MLITSRSTEKHERICKRLSIYSLLTSFRVLLSQKQFSKAGANLLPACLHNANHNRIAVHTPTNTLCTP